MVHIRNVNARKVVSFIAWKIDRLSFKYGRIYVLEMPLVPRATKVNDGGYDVKTVSDLSELTTLVERRETWWRAAVEQRFANGDLCFVAKDHGQAIACLFATFSNVRLPLIHDAPYSLPLDNETVGLIDSYTLPEYRGKGVYSSVFEACLIYFAGTRFRRVRGFIHPDNVHSMKVHQKLGLDRIVLVITSVGLFGVRRHYAKATDMHIEEVCQQ